MSFAAQALNIGCLALGLIAVALYVNNRLLEREIFQMESDAESLKITLEKIHQNCPDKVVSAFPRIPATHIIAHKDSELDGLDVEKNVTVIVLFNHNAGDDDWLFRVQITSVTNSFPKVKIFCSVIGGTIGKSAKNLGVNIIGAFRTEADAVNKAIQSVRTTYFLLLNPGVTIEPKGADGSIEWLHHALVVTPDIDIIGGSTLLSSKELVIPCYSINFCNWTMTQNYEYRRSFGEVMICEEVSRSFMARTDIRDKFSDDLFDNTLSGYLYTDFFLHAKRLGLTTANRPEVIFTGNKRGDSVNQLDAKAIDASLPFSKKHSILRFKGPDKVIKSICDGSDNSICSIKSMVEKWKLPNWYESGTFAYPFVIEQAIDTLGLVANQLQKAGIPFALRGETLFGAVMTKSVLPWGQIRAIHLWAFGRITDITTFTHSNNHKYERRDDMVTVMVKVRQFPALMNVEIIVKALKKDDTGLVNIRMNGKLYPVLSDPISELKSLYGERYLEGLDSGVGKFSCKLGKHHSCLPDMRTRGASTYREKYCEI